MQCQFSDPATGATYTWPVNPPWDGISPAQKQREIDRESTTDNTGLTEQQGDDGPIIWHWEANVFHSDQRKQMYVWYKKCDDQTIYLTDWNGEEFEGQIVTIGEQFVGALGGPGDTTANVGYWKMTFEFRVYRFISGPLADAGLKP